MFQDGTPTSKTFEHIASEIGAEEAEEVGVEHLLRDIKDTSVGSLAQRITNQLLGLKGLKEQVLDIKQYLEQIARGDLPVNNGIIYQLQVSRMTAVLEACPCRVVFMDSSQ